MFEIKRRSKTENLILITKLQRQRVDKYDSYSHITTIDTMALVLKRLKNFS